MELGTLFKTAKLKEYLTCHNHHYFKRINHCYDACWESSIIISTVISWAVL